MRRQLFLGALLLGASHAALLDRSLTADSNILLWPKWYRDTNNLALGLCKSQVESPNPESGGQPMCPIIAVSDLGVAGNIGSEAFYNFVSKCPGAQTNYTHKVLDWQMRRYTHTYTHTYIYIYTYI
jgi:hypothetical protein